MINKIKSDKSIPSGAKMLYRDLRDLSKKNGYCFASNGYLAEQYGVHKKTVSSWISKLHKNGYITITFIFGKRTDDIKERRIFLVGNNKDSKTETKCKDSKNNSSLQEEIILLKESFDNLTEKEILSVSEVFKSMNKSLDYLKEKIQFVKSSVNVNNTVGFLIKAIKENYTTKNKTNNHQLDDNKSNLKVHTRHHEIEQTWSKYSEKELEELLLKSQRNKFKDNVKEIKKNKDTYEEKAIKEFNKENLNKELDNFSEIKKENLLIEFDDYIESNEENPAKELNDKKVLNEEEKVTEELLNMNWGELKKLALSKEEWSKFPIKVKNCIRDRFEDFQIEAPSHFYDKEYYENRFAFSCRC